MLAPYAVVALEDDGRVSVEVQQRIVIGLVEKTRPLDPRHRALLVRADVDQLERYAALDQRLQLGRRQLANRSGLVGHGAIPQGWLPSVQRLNVRSEVRDDP